MSQSEFEILSREISGLQKMIKKMIEGQKTFNDIVLPAMVESMKEIHQQSPCRQTEDMKELKGRVKAIEEFIGIKK